LILFMPKCPLYRIDINPKIIRAFFDTNLLLLSNKIYVSTDIFLLTIAIWMANLLP